MKKLITAVVGAGLVVGAFFGGRFYGPSLNEVYRYIENHPQYAKEIFMHSKDELETIDPTYLESVIMQSLTEKEKGEVAESWAGDQIKQGYEEGKKAVGNFFNDIKEYFSKPVQLPEPSHSK